MQCTAKVFNASYLKIPRKRQLPAAMIPVSGSPKAAAVRFNLLRKDSFIKNNLLF